MKTTVKIIIALPVLVTLCLAAACERKPAPADPEIPEIVRDSIDLRLTFEMADGALGRTAQELADGLKRVDIFVYEASGMRALLYHGRIPGMEVPPLRLPLAELRIVAIANSPYGFNLNALARYDAMEQLAYEFVDDNPEHPVMSGETSLAPEATGEYLCSVRLLPLMCAVALEELSCDLDSYDILEEPRVRLLGINSSAGVLRFDDIIPLETMASGEWVPLGCDVGFYPLKDAAVLYCYPNDTPEDKLGVARSGIELCGMIAGRECHYEAYLPPLPRASLTKVKFSVNGEEEFYYLCKDTGQTNEARLPNFSAQGPEPAP